MTHPVGRAGQRRCRCGSCRGSPPGSGTWPSRAVEPCWPAEIRRAGWPLCSQGQRSRAGPPCSSASAPQAWVHPSPRTAAAPCRPGGWKPTRWGPPPAEDLRENSKREKLFECDIFVLLKVQEICHDSSKTTFLFLFTHKVFSNNVTFTEVRITNH